MSYTPVLPLDFNFDFASNTWNTSPPLEFDFNDFAGGVIAYVAVGIGQSQSLYDLATQLDTSVDGSFSYAQTSSVKSQLDISATASMGQYRPNQFLGISLGESDVTTVEMGQGQQTNAVIEQQCLMLVQSGLGQGTSVDISTLSCELSLSTSQCQSTDGSLNDNPVLLFDTGTSQSQSVVSTFEMVGTQDFGISSQQSQTTKVTSGMPIGVVISVKQSQRTKATCPTIPPVLFSVYSRQGQTESSLSGDNTPVMFDTGTSQLQYSSNINLNTVPVIYFSMGSGQCQTTIMPETDNQNFGLSTQQGQSVVSNFPTIPPVLFSIVTRQVQTELFVGGKSTSLVYSSRQGQTERHKIFVQPPISFEIRSRQAQSSDFGMPVDFEGTFRGLQVCHAQGELTNSTEIIGAPLTQSNSTLQKSAMVATKLAIYSWDFSPREAQTVLADASRLDIGMTSSSIAVGQKIGAESRLDVYSDVNSQSAIEAVRKGFFHTTWRPEGFVPDIADAMDMQLNIKTPLTTGQITLNFSGCPYT